MKFNLKVHAGLSEGWMVLYERNGKTDVGLIANDLVSPDVTQEKITLDVYSSLNGEAMNGKPVRVVYSMSTKPEVVYLVSDQEIMGVDPVSFTSLYTFDNLFYEVPAQRNITCFTVSSGRREFMVNDNKGYGLNASSMGSNRNTLKFGVPCKDESGELAPWCAQMATAGYMGVVYNQSTQKFRCLKNNGSALSDFSVQGKEAAFDCNQVGLELVASDFGRNNYEHILMKDASGHHYLLVADFCGIFTQNAIGKAKYDLGGCEGLDKKVVSVTAGYKGEIFIMQVEIPCICLIISQCLRKRLLYGQRLRGRKLLVSVCKNTFMVQVVTSLSMIVRLFILRLPILQVRGLFTNCV